MTPKRASPAEIVQKILIEEKVGDWPGISQRRFTGPPLIFAESLPEDVEVAVSAVDAAGLIFARGMRTGWHDTHHGVNFTVRAPNRDGYNLALDVTGVLDAVKNRTVFLNGLNHHVNNVYRQGDITRVGEEPDRRRFEWMWRARFVFESLEVTTPES